MRIAALLFLMTLPLAGVACRDSGNPGATPRPEETAPGETPVAGTPAELFDAHLQVEFGERDWVDDVGDLTIEGFEATVELDRARTDRQAFDELCTAAAGFLMQSPFNIQRVVVEDADGQPVAKAANQRPQCEPVAVSG